MVVTCVPSVVRKPALNSGSRSWISQRRPRRNPSVVSQVASHWFHPRLVGLLDDARDFHAPALELDDEQNEVANESDPGEDFDREEVHRGDGTPVRTHERPPGHASAAFRRRSEAILYEHACDGRTPNRQAQLLECAPDARVAPARVLRRQTHDQLGDIAPHARSTRRTFVPSVVLLSDQSAVPAQNRIRRRDSRDAHEFSPADCLGFDSQPSSLSIGESQPGAAQALPVQRVLRDDVLDLRFETPLKPAGNCQNKKVKRVAHLAATLPTGVVSE